MNRIKKLLAHLPYRLSFYDDNLKLIYSNNRYDGSILSEMEAETLPEWIWQSLQQTPEKALHFQLPTESFDQIIMQTYQIIYDDSGDLIGVISYHQDLKPLLSNYLTETGQAIVGWSDVTSGASIGNDFLDD